MPRRPKPPPQILRIETLSDGKEVRPPQEPLFDDFTNEPIEAVVEPISVVGPLLDGIELSLIRQRKRAADGLEVLKVLGIVPDDRPKPPRPLRKPFVRRI